MTLIMKISADKIKQQYGIRCLGQGNHIGTVIKVAKNMHSIAKSDKKNRSI
jgi:hypothetical protein